MSSFCSKGLSFFFSNQELSKDIPKIEVIKKALIGCDLPLFWNSNLCLQIWNLNYELVNESKIIRSRPISTLLIKALPSSARQPFLVCK